MFSRKAKGAVLFVPHLAMWDGERQRFSVHMPSRVPNCYSPLMHSHELPVMFHPYFPSDMNLQKKPLEFTACLEFLVNRHVSIEMCTYVCCVHTPVCEKCREAQCGTATVFISSQQWTRSVGKTVGDQLSFAIAACPTGILMTWSFISTYFWDTWLSAWNGVMDISYCHGANWVLLLFLPKFICHKVIFPHMSSI